MSVTMKIATAVVVAAMVGLGWWWSRGEVTGGRGGLEVAGERRTAAAADAGPPTSSSADAPARVAEPPPSVEVAGLELSLRVLRSDGTPVDSGQVVLFEGEEILGLGSIRDGAVEPPLPVPPRAASAIVEVEETIPRVVAIPAGAREQTIRLPEEGVLSGRFVVDGGPPPERLAIAFHGNYPPSLVGTPQSAWIALRARDAEKNGDGNFRTSFPRAGLPRVRAIVRTDAEGRFRFEGLGPGSRGRLLAPHGFTFSPIETGFDGGRSALQEFEVVVGAGPLVLELHPVPAVVGRIVDGDGIPVRDVRVLLRGTASGGAFTSSDRTNDAGRFRVGIWNGAPISAALDCFDAASGGHVRRALRHPFQNGADVGDLVLAPARWIALRVRDPEGRAIERFDVAAELPEGWQRLRAADNESREWPAPAGTTRLRVAAAGFDPEIVDLGERDGAATIEIDVELERATELIVKLRGADGGPVPGLMVQLVGRPELFHSQWLDAERPTSETTSLDETSETNLWKDAGSAHADQFADETGTARFGGLLGGVPIDVRVLGGMQEPVFDTTLQIGRGETRELLVPLPAPRSWHGQVVDEAGTPILSASVMLQWLEREHHGHFLGPSISTVTGSDGKFRFERLLVEEAGPRNFSVDVFAAGFSRHRRRLELPPPGDSSTFVLRPEWPLVVEVVDDRGVRVKSAYVTAKSAIPQPELEESVEYAASPMPSGDHRFSTLPPDPIDVRVEVGGREYARRVEPPTPRVRFEVPSASRVLVRYDLPIPEAARAGRVLGAIELVPSGRDGTTVATDTTIYDPPRRGGVVEFEDVLPGTYEVVLVWRDDEGNDLDRERIGETIRVDVAVTLEMTLAR